MVLHGFEVTDPIRNLIGLRLHDVQHRVGDQPVAVRALVSGTSTGTSAITRWPRSIRRQFHMIDSSMSNLVTTDDGVTLASVEEAAADDARLVSERSLYSTSAVGFLTGSDAAGPRGRVNPGPTAAWSQASRRAFARRPEASRLLLQLECGTPLCAEPSGSTRYTRYYRLSETVPEYWVGSERFD